MTTDYRTASLAIHAEVTSKIVQFVSKHRNDNHIIASPSVNNAFALAESIFSACPIEMPQVFTSPVMAMDVLKRRFPPRVMILAPHQSFLTAWRAQLTATAWLHTVGRLEIEEAAQFEGRFNWYGAEFTTTWADIFS